MPESSAGAHGARIIETHISLLTFVGDLVVKAKKPVRFPFVDLSSREQRAAACEAEVELNRRLAPDVYLGTGTVTGPDGVAERLVFMRRLPDDRTLTALVQRSDPELPDQLRRLAAVLADFHLRSERPPAARGCATGEWVEHLWQATLEELGGYGDILPGAELEAVARLSGRYVTGRYPLFDRRARDHAVEGHGDLLADDVFCLDDGPRILDCLEFDWRLRCGDPLSDVASLAMDLERLGRPDLAADFVSAYRAASGDAWPVSLLHHWIAYRAAVRSKIACIRAATDPDAAGEARLLLDMAGRHLRQAQVRLVLVGGLPGTGKSTLAEAIASSTGWQLIRSDVVRKQMAGVPLWVHRPDGFGSGIYRDEWTAAVYAAMLDLAAGHLSMGHSVVLDASWTRACWREQADRTAGLHAAALVQLRCVAPAEVARERILRRLEEAAGPSDATPEVAATMAMLADDWPEAITIDTGASARNAASAALAHLRPAA